MIIDKQIIRDWDVYYEDDIELIETSELNHWYEETLGYQPYRLYEYLCKSHVSTLLLLFFAKDTALNPYSVPISNIFVS